MRSAISKLLLAAVLLFLSSCNGHVNSDFVRIGTYGNIDIKCSPDFSNKEKSLLLDTAKYHIDIWIHDNYYRIDVKQILIVRGDTIICSGRILYGCIHYWNGTIYLADRNLTLWSLYHELCHLLPEDTGDHENEEWTKWQSRREEIVNDWVSKNRQRYTEIMFSH